MLSSLQKKSYFVLIILFFLALSLPFPAQAASYDVIEIAPSGDDSVSRAYGINENGDVAAATENGDDASTRRAAIWDATDGTQELTTLSGRSGVWEINDNRQVAGYSTDSNGIKQAVRWESNGAITTIGQLTTNGTGSSFGINNNGVVVGETDVDAGWEIFHAFKYQDGSSVRDLGTLGNPSSWYGGYSQAYAINNHDQSVGLAYDSSWNCHPFIHDDTNGMVQLKEDASHLAEYYGVEWYAVAINDSGMIGGHIYDYSLSGSRPYYWPDPASDPIAITLPDAYPNAEVYGINDAGQLVGLMWNGTEDHAFLFDPLTGVIDLNSLIDPASGWSLEFARDINSAGQIVGTGTLNGVTRGFMLNPTVVPEPTSCLLFGIGLLATAASRRRKRA